MRFMGASVISLKTIVVATDFEEAANTALVYGRNFARTFGAALHVVHVVNDIAVSAALTELPLDVSDLQQRLQRDAEQAMGHLITDDDRRTLDVHTHLPRSHKPSEAILEVARQVKADLIIVGTHGRGGIARFFMGSVAERVVRTAPCPVLAVRELEREFVGPDPITRFGEAGLTRGVASWLA
jgi:nucleotide-binding universal stress UspA family protein